MRLFLESGVQHLASGVKRVLRYCIILLHLNSDEVDRLTSALGAFLPVTVISIIALISHYVNTFLVITT